MHASAGQTGSHVRVTLDHLIGVLIRKKRVQQIVGQCVASRKPW